MTVWWAIYTGQSDNQILNKYDEVRRKIRHDIVNHVSSEKMLMLFQYGDAGETIEKDPMVWRMQAEPSHEQDGPPKSGLPSLRYDMAQHYRK
ncbi:hypothetical protein VTK56DRAFT_6207 [Thermocarpiscus australiensis]